MLVHCLIISYALQMWRGKEILFRQRDFICKNSYCKAALVLMQRLKFHSSLISQIISKEGSRSTPTLCGTTRDTSWNPKNSWIMSQASSGNSFSTFVFCGFPWMHSYSDHAKLSHSKETKRFTSTGHQWPCIWFAIFLSEKSDTDRTCVIEWE
jgi:hypothetical protein